MQPLDSIRIDKQVFRASEQGGTIKVSLEDPLKAVLNVQQEQPAVVNCSISANSSTNISSADDRRLYFGKRLSDWVLLMVSCVMLLVGMSSGTLLGRLYFIHGGTHRWLSTWTQTVGWPMNLVPLFFSYWWFSVRPTPLTPKLALIYVGMGCVTAFDNLLYSWGLSYLPASTNSLLCSSQLAFNALFAYALVGQKITVYVVNSVVTITMGAILLGIYAETDRPKGTTEKQYILGFVVTVAGAAIYSLMLPLMELIYRKVVGRSSFVVVLEAQTAISVVATVISMVGMWIDKDYTAIHEEAARFNLGSGAYSLTLVGSAVGWQLFFLGSAGIIFLTSSLMSCVFFTATLPVVPILAVIFFDDKFSALKGIAMLLSMWGFISYIYGGYVASRAPKTVEPDREDSQIQTF